MKLTKEEVAIRQLDTAIKLFFNAADVVSIHTLAAASATILADILENSGETSWRAQIIEEHSNLTKTDVFNILRNAQNFFKHADRDSNESLDFSEEDNDAMIWIATLECGLLLQSTKQSRKGNVRLSIPISVFQYWYASVKRDDFDMPEKIATSANVLFSGINKVPRFEQLSRGALVLKEQDVHNRNR